jgi:hypothetical protein
MKTSKKLIFTMLFLASSIGAFAQYAGCKTVTGSVGIGIISVDWEVTVCCNQGGCWVL